MLKATALAVLTALIPVSVVSAEVPSIIGSPTIDSPMLLDWPTSFPPATPDLTEPTSNRIFDLHMTMGRRDCEAIDLILSTAGNYHMALGQLWYEHLLPSTPSIESYYYTTSPPISPEQVTNETLTFANVRLNCRPHVAVGPNKLVTRLQELGVTRGEPTPFIRNRGNVMLVKRGNPKNIQTIWDLGRPDVKVVTSNPDTEPGSFGNYSGSIYNIAASDPNPPDPSFTAENLFDSIFNADTGKWLSGARIHHREVPHSIAFGDADVGLMFYHLALFAKETFPDEFDIVPLGGTAENPQPLPGNRVATLFYIEVGTELSETQEQSVDSLVEAFNSPIFTDILASFGLDRPE
ncbi:MAG: substrate-binding domain-containing protein [Elainellaceae cyanobacterium]